MKFTKSALTLAIGVVALFGSLSPANASEVSQERLNASIASLPHLSLHSDYSVQASSGNATDAVEKVGVAGGTLAGTDAIEKVKVSGGTLADTDAVEKVEVSGGTLTDCKTSICGGKGSSSGTIGGSTGSEHVAVSGGTLSSVDTIGGSIGASY